MIFYILYHDKSPPSYHLGKYSLFIKHFHSKSKKMVFFWIGPLRPSLFSVVDFSAESPASRYPNFLFSTNRHRIWRDPFEFSVVWDLWARRCLHKTGKWGDNPKFRWRLRHEVSFHGRTWITEHLCILWPLDLCLTAVLDVYWIRQLVVGPSPTVVFLHHLEPDETTTWCW